MSRPHIFTGQETRTIGQVGPDWSTVAYRKRDDGGLGIGARCGCCLMAVTLTVQLDEEGALDERGAHDRFDEIRLEHERCCSAAGQSDVFSRMVPVRS